MYSSDIPKYNISKGSFQCQGSFFLTQPRGQRMPGVRGALWHMGKEVVYVEMEGGSNLDPRAS